MQPLPRHLDPRRHLDGLSYTVASSMGVAVSVVVLTRSSQTSREELAAHVIPTNELLRYPNTRRRGIST